MMALTRLFSVACGPARGQTTQREGRKFRAQSLDRGQVRPTEEKDGRESRRKARQSAAAGLLPANGVSRTISDPPASRGVELPLLSYSYSALVSENMRKWVSDAKQNRRFDRALLIQSPKSLSRLTFGGARPPRTSVSGRQVPRKLENYFPFPPTVEACFVLLEMLQMRVSAKAGVGTLSPRTMESNVQLGYPRCGQLISHLSAVW